jgi:hypothetical protein
LKQDGGKKNELKQDRDNEGRAETEWWDSRKSWNRMERSRQSCDRIDTLLAVQSSATNLKDHPHEMSI